MLLNRKAAKAGKIGWEWPGTELQNQGLNPIVLKFQTLLEGIRL